MCKLIIVKYYFPEILINIFLCNIVEFFFKMIIKFNFIKIIKDLFIYYIYM